MQPGEREGSEDTGRTGVGILIFLLSTEQCLHAESQSQISTASEELQSDCDLPPSALVSSSTNRTYWNLSDGIIISIK